MSRLYSILRKTRGIVLTAITWAVAWVLAGELYGVITQVLPRGVPQLHLSPLPIFVAIAEWWGITGALAGSAFAILLIIAERRASIESISTIRMALWGGLAGVVYPALATIWLLLSRGNEWPLD